MLLGAAFPFKMQLFVLMEKQPQGACVFVGAPAPGQTSGWVLQGLAVSQRWRASSVEGLGGVLPVVGCDPGVVK